MAVFLASQNEYKSFNYFLWWLARAPGLPVLPRLILYPDIVTGSLMKTIVNWGNVGTVGRAGNNGHAPTWRSRPLVTGTTGRAAANWGNARIACRAGNKGSADCG